MKKDRENRKENQYWKKNNTTTTTENFTYSPYLSVYVALLQIISYTHFYRHLFILLCKFASTIENSNANEMKNKLKDNVLK